jgi:LysR family transcriptional regulator, glycine cleavage system transcriptional activator
MMIRDPGLSWSQLRAFDACARFSSFNTAALRLSVSASAIRFQISLLESRLGVSLFDRNGGRLALTEIGRIFASRIERPINDLLAACEAAQQSVKDAPLVLTVPPLFAREYLLVEPFLKWCDANLVRLDVSDTKRDLFAPGLIAAIRLDAEVDPDLLNALLLHVQLCIAAAPEIASSSRPNDPGWWREQTLLTPSAGEGGWTSAWRKLNIANDLSRRFIPFSSYSAALEAACAGSGLILAPLPFAEKEIAAGRLGVISDVRIVSPRGYSLIMRKGFAVSPRACALTRMVSRTCRASL